MKKLQNIAKNKFILKKHYKIFFKYNNIYYYSYSLIFSLSSNEGLPEKMQLIIYNKYYSVAIEDRLCVNKNLCKKLQLKFANDKDSNLRAMLAGNEGIDTDIYNILIKDKYYNVIACMAENEKMPIYIQHQVFDKLFNIFNKNQSIEIIKLLLNNDGVCKEIKEKCKRKMQKK